MTTLHKKNQKILITGGTGFIGKQLSQLFIEQNNQVTILTRNIKKAESFFNGRVTLINSLNKINEDEDFDIIINFAGETISRRWNKKSKKEILDSRINTTKALISLLKRLKQKPSVFVSGSAIGFYGTSEEKEFDEDSKSNKNDISVFPREICEKWENEAKKAEKLGIRTCLLRTGVVLESDGGALAKMLFPFKFCLGGPIGNGKQWFSWIHREDLIRLIIHIINDTKISGAINGTAPEPVSNKTFSKELGKAIKRPAILPLPAFQVKLLFGEMGKALLLSGQKVLPKKALKNGFKFKYPNIEKALRKIFLYK